MHLTARNADAETIMHVGTGGRETSHKVYMGSLSEARRGPQAFTGTFPPDYVLRAHFHLCDQFQIFIDGEASIGHVQLMPVTVQYADSSTTYGPIKVGPAGMTFYNFRAHSDVTAHFMPGSKDKMEHRRGRLITVRTRLDGKRDTARGFECRNTMIELDSDGLAAHEVVAGPDTTLLERNVTGSGLFQLVVHGSISIGEGAPLVEREVSFVPAGDRVPARQAGADGVHLLELQLPAL
jgi:hypothetical protein